MSDALDWAGLSSRLSAYSLSGQEAPTDPAADDDASKQDPDDSESE